MSKRTFEIVSVNNRKKMQRQGHYSTTSRNGTPRGHGAVVQKAYSSWMRKGNNKKRKYETKRWTKFVIREKTRGSKHLERVYKCKDVALQEKDWRLVVTKVGQNGKRTRHIVPYDDKSVSADMRQSLPVIKYKVQCKAVKAKTTTKKKKTSVAKKEKAAVPTGKKKKKTSVPKKKTSVPKKKTSVPKKKTSVRKKKTSVPKKKATTTTSGSKKKKTSTSKHGLPRPGLHRGETMISKKDNHTYKSTLINKKYWWKKVN